MKNHWGRVGWPRGIFCHLPQLPAAGNTSYDGVTGLHLPCPLVLIFGREVKGLKVCRTEMRSGGIVTMPSGAARLDSAKARAAVSFAKLRNGTLGLRGGPLHQQLPLQLEKSQAPSPPCTVPWPAWSEWRSGGLRGSGGQGRSGLQSESESEFSSSALLAVVSSAELPCLRNLATSLKIR